jgi:hypothetical protein
VLDDVPTLEDGPEFSRELWRAFRRAVADHAGDGPGDLHQLALDVAGCSAELRGNVDDTVYALSGRTLTSLVEQVQEDRVGRAARERGRARAEVARTSEGASGLQPGRPVVSAFLDTC